MRLEYWCPLRLEAAAARRGARGATVVRTGMGPERARRFATGRNAATPAVGGQALPARVPPRRAAAVVLGLAGATCDSSAPGDVIVAEAVHGPGRPRLPDGEVAEAVESHLTEAGLAVRRGGLCSVERPARGPERDSLRGAGALAADMESWWLMEADPAPLAVVRVICDTPTAELVRFSLPWRVRRALLVISRIAATLDPREGTIQPTGTLGQGSSLALDVEASGGGS